MSIATPRTTNASEAAEEHRVRGRAAERRLFLDAYALTASTIFSALAGLLATGVAGHLFSTSAVGRAAALTSAMMLVSGISQLDLTNALHRFLPGSGHSARRLVLGSYALAGMTAFVLSIPFSLVYGNKLFESVNLGTVLLFAAAVVAWSIFNLQDQVLVGLGATVVVPIENATVGLVRVALIFMLVGGGAYAIFASFLIPVVAFVVIISALIALRVFPAHVKRCGDAVTIWDVRTVSRFVSANYPGAVSALAVANILPLMVNSHLGSEVNGTFAIMWMAIITLDLVGVNFGAAVVVQGANSPEHISSLLRSAIRRMLLLVVPALVVLALLAPPVIKLLVPELYSPQASTMLRLLCVGLLFRLCWFLYLPASRLRGRLRAVTSTQLLASLLILTGTYVGLVNWGLPGIGLGYIAAQLTMLLILSPELIPMFLGKADAVEAADASTVSIAKRSGAHHRRRSHVRLLFISLWEDFCMAFFGIFVNRLAASILTPRVLRYCIYRAFGMRLQTANIFWGAQFAEGKTILGKGTFVNTNVHFEDIAPIRIGDDCQIGMEVLFVTSHHSTAEGVISKEPEPREIFVGNRCWIGARAVILPGVRIGNDCVIAAGAVVAKDCEPSGVYAGVPARRIKELNPRRKAPRPLRVETTD